MTGFLPEPLAPLWDAVVTLFRSGGDIMWPLLATGVVLWYLLGLRTVSLLSRARVSLPDGVSPIGDAVRRIRALHGRSGRRAVGEAEIALRERARRLERGGAVTEILVVAAPLLGLLGTVSGMMVTFDALTDMALFTQSGGIAGGIAEALTTTQMGLGIAVPGLLVHRLLERRARRLRREIEAAVEACRELLAAEGKG